jgi:hypothetical protein
MAVLTVLIGPDCLHQLLPHVTPTSVIVTTRTHLTQHRGQDLPQDFHEVPVKFIKSLQQLKTYTLGTDLPENSVLLIDSLESVVGEAGVM